MNNWKKGHITWIAGRTLFASIPFTWELPNFRKKILQKSLEWDRVIVGGPALKFFPDYFDKFGFVKVGEYYPGVLQMFNPMATRTSIGCPNNCGFCGVKDIEGKFKTLDDWPDLPIICDSNFLAGGSKHFDRVCDRLEKHSEIDIESIDIRFLKKGHVERLCRLNSKIFRIALDDSKSKDLWLSAVGLMKENGIPKYKIKSFVLSGFDSDPADAWDRCEFVVKNGVKPSPMFYHSLKTLKWNSISKEQRELGWNDYERRRLMQWFYQHKKAVKYE